jgi:hypothetical protein
MGTGGVAGFASLPRSGLLEHANAADRLQLRQIFVLSGLICQPDVPRLE